MKPNSPLVFRLEPELHERLEKCAENTRLKKYTLAIMAIEAAVEAIEKNNYKLVVPIEFQVAQVPTNPPKNSSSSNSTQEMNPSEQKSQGPTLGAATAAAAKKNKAA